MPNNRLLRLYGFVIPDNPHDSYDLVLSTVPVAPFYEEKQKVWALAGLDSTYSTPLTLTDPLPNSVLQCLRIQRLDKAGLLMLELDQNHTAQRKVSNENEMEILHFLVESFEDILNCFRTPLETLHHLAKNVYPAGGNLWAAAHVSIGEQRVLRLAKKRAEDLLAAVQKE
jgi:hypothetical protein